MPDTRIPRHLQFVESKIKDEVARYKIMAKDKSNRLMFNKDPVVFANPHPSEMGYEHPDPYYRSQKRRSASLRKKSPRKSMDDTN